MTVAEYQRLTAIGTLTEDDPIELLAGWVVEKPPKTPLHDGSLDLLDGMLRKAVPTGWFIRNQGSLVTDDSVPEPDLVVARGRPGDYCHQLPTGNDLSLVVEVADHEIERHRKKVAIYARAGVPEYWIVNLEDWQLERMTQPQSDGTFAASEVLHARDVVPVTIASAVVATLPLDELLTPPH